MLDLIALFVVWLLDILCSCPMLVVGLHSLVVVVLTLFFGFLLTYMKVSLLIMLASTSMNLMLKDENMEYKPSDELIKITSS